jgi:hypothetical protein
VESNDVEKIFRVVLVCFSIKLVTLMHAIYILGVRGILDSSSVLLTTIMEPIKEELIKSKY